jgi:TolB protein
MSRDSKMVAYTWITAEGRCELRTIPLETSSPGQPRRLFYSGDVEYVVPFDWSPDGTQIAVGLEHRDGPRIGLVSAIDGSLRVLKSARGDPSKMFFSPDGRNLAYDLPADGNAGQRDVFVMAVDGSRDVAAVAHPSNDTLAGWSPDGKHLLFLSDRAGSRGLWNQPVVDGKPQDAAVPIKADLGSSSHSFGITASGSLYVRTRLQGENEIWVLENFLPKTAAVR